MRYITSLLIFLCIGVSHIKANDLKLKFDKPAEFFEEAFVIGNGTQGAIVYGNPYRERISLNDITFWTGEPDTAVVFPGAYKYLPLIREALKAGDYSKAEELQKHIQGHNSQRYQPIGNLIIDFHDKDSIKSYHRELDLTTATVTTDYARSKYAVTTRYIASAPDSVIAVNIVSEKPISLTLFLESPLNNFHTWTEGNVIIADGCADDSADSLCGVGKGINFRSIVNVLAKKGRIRATDNKIEVSDTKNLTIYVSVVTNFAGAHINPNLGTVDYKNIVKKRAERIYRMSFEDVLSRHKADYGLLFSRVALDLGDSSPEIITQPLGVRLKNYTDNNVYDPDLEELYFQYGRYLLISCSRTTGVPANLQGLWNEYIFPPWSSNYTANINVEENYWPAEVTNLSELHMPLLTFIKQLPKTGHETAKEYYGVNRGWSTGHNTDIWAMTNPTGMHKSSPSWSNWNMGGTWLSTHIWEHYMFTLDEDFLREYYPVLKGAAEFCLGWMMTDENGNLFTSPSTSPENKFIAPDGNAVSTSEGGFADIGMIKECLTATREAANILNTDIELVKEIDEAIGRLAPYKIGSNGQLQEWYLDFKEEDPRHRHQSHLFGLFPGHHIRIDNTPDLAEAALRTLEIKGSNTTGWSAGWRVNLLARLRQGEKAYSMYRRLLRYVSPDKYKGPDARGGGGTYPNLLDAHPPFQIDGNFGGTSGVAEMLIQSRPDVITLLPAIPEQWKDGEFKGLRARGAFSVDASWKDGKVTEFSIKADRGGSTVVNVNGAQVPVTLVPSESKSFKF